MIVARKSIDTIVQAGSGNRKVLRMSVAFGEICYVCSNVINIDSSILYDTSNGQWICN